MLIVNPFSDGLGIKTVDSNDLRKKSRAFNAPTNQISTSKSPTGEQISLQSTPTKSYDICSNRSYGVPSPKSVNPNLPSMSCQSIKIQVWQTLIPIFHHPH